MDCKSKGMLHNYKLIFFSQIPNGLWIVVPGAIIYTLGKDIISRLGAHPKQI